MIDRAMISIQTLAVAIIASLLLVGPAHASEPSARDLLDSAAQAMQAGEYEKAIELYDRSREMLPELAGIPYNMAVAEHRLGRYDEAAKLFEEARALARDPSLRADAAYNLGSSAYNQSLQSLGVGAESTAQQPEQPDLEHALKRLGEALQHYRSALAADPSDDAARRNAESAYRLRRMIEELQQQQQQQQQSGEGDDSEQQDQQQQSQQNQTDGREQPDQRSQPSPDRNEPQQRDSGEQNQQQQRNQPSQQLPNDQQEQNQPQPPAAEPQQGRQPGEQQPEPTDDGEQSQEKRDEQTRSADGEERESRSGRASEDARAGQAGGEPDDAPLDREQVERLLQRIRDMARERREALAEQQRARYKPAEKDW